MNVTNDRKLLGLSILLFLISLGAPAFTYDGKVLDRESFPGLEALAMGWFSALFELIALPQGAFQSIGLLSWFANPLLVAAWFGLFQRERRMAMYASIGAIGLSLLFLSLRTIHIPDNNTLTNVLPSIGYFLWVSSMVCVVITAYRLQDNRGQTTNK